MIALVVVSIVVALLGVGVSIYYYRGNVNTSVVASDLIDKIHELRAQQDALAAKIKEHGAPVGEFRPPKFLNQNAVVFRRARLATMDHLFTDKEMLRARKRFDRAVKRGWIKDHDPIVTTDGLGESWTEFTGTGGTAIITY